ncbi:Hypothetical predicted protein [Cloeon dipterum]|uniref:Glutathione transferase n=2 Tax=Cloeon dipterum TaxID=197152 RepID=A0A8S1E679_9INSE|nr:Hypothetical predicted protein [Cloeon dipterum]
MLAEKAHLAEGSTKPPVENGVVRIYAMRFCPFAQRSLLAATAKGIKFDVVNVNLEKKPKWFLEMHPAVPILEHDDGRFVIESLIVADYLDEIGDSNISLHPRDPYKKAKDRVLVDKFNSVIGPFINCLLSFGKPEPDVKLFDAVLNNLDRYETELKNRNCEFFGGERPAMLDFMIWPFFERFEQFTIFGGKEFLLPEKRFPKLSKWMTSMLGNEAVKMWLLPAEAHAQYTRNVHFAGGSKDFDFLVDVK